MYASMVECETRNFPVICKFPRNLQISLYFAIVSHTINNDRRSDSHDNGEVYQWSSGSACNDSESDPNDRRSDTLGEGFDISRCVV